MTLPGQRRQPARDERRCQSCGTTLAADNTACLCGRCLREHSDQLLVPPRLTDEFFDTDEFRAAFESQKIGRVFKAYRNHSRHLRLYGKALNQELLGRWLGLKQATVSKLENGKLEEDDLKVLRYYAETLHMPKHLLWFDFPGQTRFDRSTSLRTITKSDADRALSYPADLTRSVASLAQLTSSEFYEPAKKLQVVPEAWDTIVVRWLMDSDRDTFSDRARPMPITTNHVDAVRDATTMLATFDYKYGGGRPLPLVARFLDIEVMPHLADVSPADPVGREYFREVAALTRLAGWTAYDMGAHGLAQRYLFQAFRLAKAAGDKPLCGRILAGMSHQANFLGQHERAADLARAAYQGARGHATPTTMALFHAMEARALANLGQEAETTAALMEAERWHSQGNPSNDPRWIHYFDAAELHAEFAHCFRDLDRPELANQHAATSIRESSSLFVRSLSFCRTVLATSHLQNGELDEALAVALDVVDTAATLKSYRVLSYLEDFRQRVSTTHGHDSAVREFNGHIATRLPSMDPPASR